MIRILKAAGLVVAWLVIGLTITLLGKLHPMAPGLIVLPMVFVVAWITVGPRRNQ